MVHGTPLPRTLKIDLTENPWTKVARLKDSDIDLRRRRTAVKWVGSVTSQGNSFQSDLRWNASKYLQFDAWRPLKIRLNVRRIGKHRPQRLVSRPLLSRHVFGHHDDPLIFDADHIVQVCLPQQLFDDRLQGYLAKLPRYQRH